MNAKSYFELLLSHVHVDFEDDLVFYLFENGAAGVQENLAFSQQDRKYLPRVEEQDVKTLIAYFDEKPSSELLEDLLEIFPQITVVSQKQEGKDWLEGWKREWKPFPLAGSYWVVPSWLKDGFAEVGADPIYIDPGMAFGTGTHATTQIAAELILEVLQSNKIEAALDVGTGSGILAIVMEKQGVPSVHAYDNDEESLRVYLENLEKNNVQKAHWCEKWSEELSGKVDLVVANIIDGVLVDLKPEFQKVESEGTIFVFTGIVAEREQEFLNDMLDGWGLREVKRLQRGEWVGYIFQGRHS